LYEIISALKQSAIVLDVEILELIDEDSVKLIKIKAVLKENCLLYITELHTKDYQKYSYHCQKNDGDLIVRWDNKPHWKDDKALSVKSREVAIWNVYKILLIDFLILIHNSSFDTNPSQMTHGLRQSENWASFTTSQK
jgi:hypothetical protein